MIGRVSRWQSVRELLRFLYGPGDVERHVDPRLIAGDRQFPYLGRLEPPVRPNGRRDIGALARALELPFATLAGCPDRRPVWHCLLQAAPEDRLLLDAEWADAAQEVMARTGLATPGDDGGVRWVAVRHGDNHIHLVVPLARQDGTKPNVWQDCSKVRAACAVVEDRFGLRRLGRRAESIAPVS